MTLKPHADIVWIDSDDGVRMYDARSNEFRELNHAGADIWRLAVAGNDEDSIVSELGRSYEAQSESDWGLLRRDIRTFLQQLVDAQVLVEAARPETAPVVLPS